MALRRAALGRGWRSRAEPPGSPRAARLRTSQRVIGPIGEPDGSGDRQSGMCLVIAAILTVSVGAVARVRGRGRRPSRPSVSVPRAALFWTAAVVAVVAGCTGGDGIPSASSGAPPSTAPAAGSTRPAAASSPSPSIDATPPFEPVAAASLTVEGALVELDRVSLQLRVVIRSVPCTTTYDDVGVDVVESDAEVRLAARGTPVPITTWSPVTVACTGGGQLQPVDVRLTSPLGSRTLVDEHAGVTLHPVWRSEVLVPTPLPDGWVGTEEHFSSTPTGARWFQRFQPDPLTVMAYGLDVRMSWGGDCRAEFDAFIGTAASLTPVTLRGLDGEQTDELGGPNLYWVEQGACVHLWGLGSCRSSAGGCQVIDRAQLMALAESLAPPPAGG